MLSTFPGNLLIQQGIIQNLNDSVVINKLPAGMYQINIKDSYGNEKVIYTEVKQPLPLQVQSKYPVIAFIKSVVMEMQMLL